MACSILPALQHPPLSSSLPCLPITAHFCRQASRMRDPLSLAPPSLLASLQLAASCFPTSPATILLLMPLGSSGQPLLLSGTVLLARHPELSLWLRVGMFLGLFCISCGWNASRPSPLSSSPATLSGKPPHLSSETLGRPVHTQLLNVTIGGRTGLGVPVSSSIRLPPCILNTSFLPPCPS